MKKILLLGLVTVFSITAIFAQSDLQPIATVKLHRTESITLKQLKQYVSIYEQQFPTVDFTVEDRKNILDALIDETLLLHAAEKAGMTLTEAIIDQVFAQYILQTTGMQLTEEQFSQAISEQTGMSLNDYIKANVGMDLASYKRTMGKSAVIQQFVLMLKQDEIIARATPTDAEIRAYYDVNKANLVQNDIVEYFLVIVSKEVHGANAEKLANEMREDLLSGAVTQEELRLKQNQDGAGFAAGIMYMAKGTPAAEYYIDLFSKDTGHATDVEETDVDFQFLIVTDQIEAKMLKLDDLIQPGTTMTVYEYVKNGLSQEKAAALLGEVMQEVTAELRTPENYTVLKTDSALNTLLDW